jgi:hypothetical protein
MYFAYLIQHIGRLVFTGDHV